jgi:hypothetical protein
MKNETNLIMYSSVCKYYFARLGEGGDYLEGCQNNIQLCWDKWESPLALECPRFHLSFVMAKRKYVDKRIITRIPKPSWHELVLEFMGWPTHSDCHGKKKKENLVQRDETDYWLGAVIGIFYDGRVECDNISCLFICYVVNTRFCALTLSLNSS